MHHINQLRAVVALAEHRSFSRAAESIGLTQSALSQNIKKLEDHYGVALFDRRHGRVDLTTYGEMAVATGRDMIGSIDALRADIGLLQNYATGRISVGVDPYLASSVVGPVLADLLKSYPNLKFVVKSGRYDLFEAVLRGGDIDVFVGYPPQHVPPDLDVDLLQLPTPIVVCAPDHPLSSSAQVTLREIIAFPIVTPAPPAWYVAWAQAQIADAGQEIEIEQLMILEADSIAMVKIVVRGTQALTAALPSDLIEEFKAGLLRPVAMANWPLTMPGCVVTPAGRPITPAARLFMDACSQHLLLELQLRKTLAAKVA